MGGGAFAGGRALRWGRGLRGEQATSKGARLVTGRACLFPLLVLMLWALFVFKSIPHVITHSFVQFLKIYNL